MARLRRLVPELWAAAVLLLLPLIVFAPVTLGNRTLLPADNLLAIEPWRSAAEQFGASEPPVPHNKLLDDLVLENYPWKKFILESLQARELPLWNPYQFAGLPFLAAGQHSALYPFSVVFYVLPLARAYGVFIVSQLFLAGLFAYTLLRVLGLSRPSALLGAIVYELSLFMVRSAVFPMIVAGAVWLPLVLTAVELCVRQQPALGGRPATLPWMALGAAAIGLQILAGHVEITYYTLLIAAAYSAWRLGGNLLAVRRAPAGERRTGLRRMATRAAMLLALAGLGLALSAVQLIPLYEIARLNFRSGSASFEQIVKWSYPWRHVLHFLIPNFYGNSSHHGYFDLFTWQWTPATVNALGEPIDTIAWGIKNSVEGGGYFGLLTLALSVIGVWRGLVAPWLGRRGQGAAGPDRGRGGSGPHPPPLPPGRHSASLRGTSRAPQGNGDPGSERLGDDGHDVATAGTPGAPLPTTQLLFFTLLAGAALAFMFPTRLYALIFWLPGIDQLHSPFRWVWPFTLCAAVLSACGFETLRRDWAAGAALQASAKAAGIGARLGRLWHLGAPPSLATALAGLGVWGGLATLAGLAAARLGYEALDIGRLMGWLLREMAQAELAFDGGRMLFSYEARWLAQAALLAIGAGLALRLSRSPRTWRGRAAWEWLALGVIVVDLGAAGWGFNPAADPAILTYTPPSVEFMQQHDSGLWRFTTYIAPRDEPPAPTEPQKPFNANAGWYFNFHDIRGYDSIFTRQYKDFMELIQPQYELDFNRIAPISVPEALDSPLLDLLNVRYVFTSDTIDNPKYSLIYEGEIRIYRNETALPRAFTQPLSQAVVVPDFGVAVQQYDPRTYVLLERAGAEPPPAVPAPAWPSPVDDIRYRPNEVFVTATVAEPAWLVLADSYFPGWRAYARPAGTTEAEEEPLTISLVNGNFRGVQLPAGSWTVRFKYSPDSVKVGAIVSFTAGVTLVFLLGVFAWRYFYRESAVDSTARRVAKNSLAPIVLNLGNRVIDLAFAAFMLRVLGPGDAGKYYFAVVVFGWFEIVTNYGLDTLLMRDVARDREHASRYLVNTTLLRMGLGLAAIPILALLLLARQTLPSFVLPLGLGEFHPDRLTADTLWAIGLLVLAQAPATVATGLAGLFRAFEKAEYPAAVATVATLVRVSLGTVALVLGLGFVGLAGASIVVNLVTLSILAALAWRQFAEIRRRPRLDVAFQRHAVRESFPLMLNNLLATIFYKVDVTLLEPIRGPQEVGWYSTGYKYIDAYNIVPSLFTFALFPVLSRQAQADPGALRRSYTLGVKLLSAIALPLAVVTSALAPVLVGVLGGAEYLPQGATALAILVWSIPFGWINSLTNYVLIALGQQRALTRAFAAAVIFNVVLNLALLPRYGFAAAAAVTIASEFFEGLAFYRYLRRSMGRVPWVGVLGRLWLSGGLMAAVTFGLWLVQPVLALGAGLGVYTLSLAVLRPFTPDERDVLAGILPERLRRRVRQAA